MASAITSFDVAVDETYGYPLAGSRYAVPMVLTLKCTTDKPLVLLTCLPFGLLVDVRVTDSESPPAPYRLHIAKTTGVGDMEEAVPSGVRVSAAGPPLGNDQDAADAVMKTVKDWTGHDFRHRAINADTIVSIGVEWYAAGPRAFTVQYYCVNVLPRDMTPTEAVAAVAARTRLDFGLPPVPPAKRLKLASTAVGAGP
jgi:hypothetical protein